MDAECDHGMRDFDNPAIENSGTLEEPRWQLFHQDCDGPLYDIEYCPWCGKLLDTVEEEVKRRAEK